MNLVALVGFIGSGKDTVGRHLVETHGYYDIAFADALKDTCAAVFCWDREMLDGKNPQSREWRTPGRFVVGGAPRYSPFHPRWALQHVGTDVMRKFIRDDLWILNVRRRIAKIREQHGPDTKNCFDGWSLPNELAMIRELGGSVIRVKRGPEPSWFEGLAAYASMLPEDIQISHLWANTSGGTKILPFIKEGVAQSVPSERVDEIYAAIYEALTSGLHVSEWAWVGSKFETTLNNDRSLDCLFGQVDGLMRRA